MEYQLELGAGSQYVYFRPVEISRSAEEVSRRRQAIGDFARANGLTRVLFDYRDRNLPPDLTHYDVAVEARQSLIHVEWRVAFLTSAIPASYSLRLVKGLARLLVGMTLNAACFTDQAAAVQWLLSEEPPPPDGLTASS